jgi:hypothetical protein
MQPVEVRVAAEDTCAGGLELATAVVSLSDNGIANPGLHSFVVLQRVRDGDKETV